MEDVEMVFIVINQTMEHANHVQIDFAKIVIKIPKNVQNVF